MIDFKLPVNLTLEDIVEAVAADDNIGFCLVCGDESTVEPDARGYLCGMCGQEYVYGAEEILLMLG